MNGVAHLRDLREHHRRSRTHQEIRCIADCRIGGNPGKCIASPTLQTHDEIGCRTNLSSSYVELYETLFSHLHNRLNHIAKTPMRVVLQANDIRSRGEN